MTEPLQVTGCVQVFAGAAPPPGFPIALDGFCDQSVCGSAAQRAFSAVFGREIAPEGNPPAFGKYNYFKQLCDDAVRVRRPSLSVRRDCAFNFGFDSDGFNIAEKTEIWKSLLRPGLLRRAKAFAVFPISMFRFTASGLAA